MARFGQRHQRINAPGEGKGRDSWVTVLVRLPAPLAEALDAYVVDDSSNNRSEVIRRAIEQEVCL